MIWFFYMLFWRCPQMGVLSHLAHLWGHIISQNIVMKYACLYVWSWRVSLLLPVLEGRQSEWQMCVAVDVCLSVCLSVSLCRVKACSCSRFRASSPSVASSRASFVSFDKCFVKSVQLYKGTKQPSTPGRVGLSVLEHTVILLTVFLCSQRRHQQLQHQRRRPADLRGLRQVMAVDRSVSPALFYYIYNIYLKYYIYIKFDNNLNVEISS